MALVAFYRQCIYLWFGHGRILLEEFFIALNLFYETIKFTWSVSNSLSHLGVEVSLAAGFIVFLLIYIVYILITLIEGLAILIILSKQYLSIAKLYAHDASVLRPARGRSWFTNKDYDNAFLVLRISYSKALKRKPSANNGCSWPLVLDFHPSLSGACSIITIFKAVFQWCVFFTYV